MTGGVCVCVFYNSEISKYVELWQSRGKKQTKSANEWTYPSDARVERGSFEHTFDASSNSKKHTNIQFNRKLWIQLQKISVKFKFVCLWLEIWVLAFAIFTLTIDRRFITTETNEHWFVDCVRVFDAIFTSALNLYRLLSACAYTLKNLVCKSKWNGM